MPNSVASSLASMIRPMPGKIAVLVESKSEWTPGGLLIPLETARSIHEARATQGTVVAIGGLDPDELDPDPNVNIGDVVVFGKYSGIEIKWQPPAAEDGPRPPQERVILLEEKSILAVLTVPEQAGELKVKG